MPWDPAQRTALQHEYDDLVRPIVAHLMNSDDELAFASALIAVLRDEYGLGLEDADEEADARSFASSVIGWWRSR